jgi:hypothetical protein
MRIAYLILTHKLPSQLRILIDLCQHPEADFYIHLDKKVNLKAFSDLLTEENIFFIQKRVRCRWGTYSLVQATLNGLKEIQSKGGYDYINFISGQDLPLVSVEDFSNFLEKNKGHEFMSCKPYDKMDPWWKKNESRFLKYNFQNWMLPGKFRMQFLFNRVMPERKMPLGMVLSGESQWFCITTVLTDYLLQFLDTNPDYVRFFKYVWGADEFIFSTIAFNSPFRPALAGILHYIDWDGPSDGHPKTLGVADLEDAFASGKIFARKFDITHDLDAVDQVANKVK